MVVREAGAGIPGLDPTKRRAVGPGIRPLRWGFHPRGSVPRSLPRSDLAWLLLRPIEFPLRRRAWSCVPGCRPGCSKCPETSCLASGFPAPWVFPPFTLDLGAINLSWHDG